MHNSLSRPAEITITIPARLHLGFLDLNGGLGRQFGSIGLAISDLKTRLTIRRSRTAVVSGPGRDRVQRYLSIMERSLALVGAHAVDITQTVPGHAGLGSGTQLALAVSAGLRRLHGLQLDVEADALKLGRGARSGIGIGLFHRGGLVVDGGHGSRPGVAPIISHLRFPSDWRILIVLDPKNCGMHGTEEARAFAGLQPMPQASVAQICRLVLIKALPALAESDIANFGAAIKELQARLGSYFASVQGGRSFKSPAVAAILASLDAAGAHGVGQSSWGPTGYAFAGSVEEADSLAGLARQHPKAGGLDIRICSGLNHGAKIVERLARC